VLSRAGKKLIRLDYGSSLDSIPILQDLGNIGGLFIDPIGIDLVKEGGNWYGLMVDFSNWELQVRSIEECLRVTRNGGITLFSEGFWEPLMLLNAIRGLKSLPPLEEHDFNKYLKKKKLEEYLKKNNLSYQVIDFSSIYYLGSRFLRELVTNPDDYPGYSNPINKIFHDIEKEFSGGDFGIQQAFVIQKR